MNRLPIVATLALAASLAACGGNTTAASSPTPPTPSAPCEPVTAPSAQPAAPSGILSNAAAVAVESGRITQGIDVRVSSPPSSPPNAQSLGVSAGTCLSGASAFNTGASIRRGATGKVTVFGQGISHSMAVTIPGPADIQIVEICPSDLMSTNGVPGMSFRITVASGAALGARTVLLQDNTSGLVTAFTGGLEVVP